MLFACALLALLAIAGLLASWFVTGRLVAARPRAVGAPPADLRATAFLVESDSGAAIAGWHARARPGCGVVVLVHGIYGTRRAMVERARLLLAADYSTVMIDLRAHGESPGDTITLGDLERHDVRAAVAYARREHPGEAVGLIGVSLGGVAAVLASPLDVDALVIESVYPDIDTAVRNRVAAQLGPLAWLPATLLLVQLEPRLGVARSALRPLDRMAGLGCPVLLLSGAEDPHTTVADTRTLFDAAREPKELWLVDGAGHVDLHAAAPAAYAARIGGFLGRHLRD